MGYREYAKDYEIEYVQRPGKKRPKAVRIYVGPYYSLDIAPDRLKKLKQLFLLALGALAIFLLFPMLIDCGFTRTWYVQVPAAISWIPWVFAATSVWTLWRAGERFDREHRDCIYNRMGGSALFLIVFCGISFVGCVVGLFLQSPGVEDIAVTFCCLMSLVVSVVLFVFRRQIKFVQLENPEKPQAKKKTK